MGNFKENFCRYLSEWKNKNFNGTQKEFGEKFGVSQSLIAKTLSGERWGNEYWRRDIAKKIGVKYDIMIGIDDPKNIDKKGCLVSEFEEQINKFKRKDKCLLAISNLQEMEKLDRTTFFRVVTEIEDMTCRLKEKKEKNQILSEPFIKENGNNINESRVKPLLPESDPEPEHSH